MIKEEDIVYENGNYWVLKSKKGHCYFVMGSSPGNTHSVSDSTYSLDDDGLSIAIARCNWMAKRAKEKNNG